MPAGARYVERHLTFGMRDKGFHSSLPADRASAGGRHRLERNAHSVMKTLKNHILGRLRRTRVYPRLLRLKRPLHAVKRAAARTKRGGRPGRFCRIPWLESCVLSDGTIVCGCYDALALVPLGDLRRESFSEIWNGRRYRSLRRKMLRDPGLMYLCHDCPFAIEQDVSARDADRFEERAGAFPERLHVEPTVRCNLRCPACGRELAARSRRQPDMPFELYERVITEVGPHITYLNLYDYGESFLHPRIFDMIELAKHVNPEVTVVISTNGMPLHTEQRRARLISTGCDEVIFSVDGASPETYSTYRAGGDFDRVIANMRALVAERNACGSATPRVVWRYILFQWNDSDEEMARARALAAELRVDWFCWLTTTTPAWGYSRRFVPGSSDFESIRDEMFPSIEAIYSGAADRE